MSIELRQDSAGGLCCLRLPAADARNLRREIRRLSRPAGRAAEVSPAICRALARQIRRMEVKVKWGNAI